MTSFPAFSSGKTIFYSLAALVLKILFLPLENKIHIIAPPCNILYIFHMAYFPSLFRVDNTTNTNILNI